MKGMEMTQELTELKELCEITYGVSDSNNHISNFSFVVLEKVLSEKKDLMQQYGITDCELYVLLLLVGFHADAIQIVSENAKNFTEKCRFYLNSLLSKTPQTKSEELYRQEELYRIDLKRMKYYQENGIPYTHPCYLTTSTDDYDNKDCKFIITPLKNGKTKGHDVFVIYNHGEQCPYPENQVEFELGAKFMIDKIEGTTIYMQEIE